MQKKKYIKGNTFEIISLNYLKWIKKRNKQLKASVLQQKQD